MRTQDQTTGVHQHIEGVCIGELNKSIPSFKYLAIHCTFVRRGALNDKQLKKLKIKCNVKSMVNQEKH